MDIGNFIVVCNSEQKMFFGSYALDKCSIERLDAGDMSGQVRLATQR